MYFSPDHTEQILTLLFAAFCTVSMIQLLYTLWIHGSLLRKNEQITGNQLPAISVIICARNEADNIFKNLAIILEQDYPKFEVIVVNHQSTDDSKYILHAMQQTYKHLRVIEIAKNNHLKHGKKLPLSMGIKGAKYPYIMLTDADCQPTNRGWLIAMARNFSDSKPIVLGYGPYISTGGFLNKMIRFDTAWVGMNYLGSARAGFGYMGVGRNMGYTKELFMQSSGFKNHYALLSGDDDLFFQEIAKNKNYSIEIDPNSFVYSEPKDTWQDWFNQKRRHFTTAPHYKVIKKWMLGTYPLTLFLQLLTFVILLFNPTFRMMSLLIFIGVFGIKWIIQGRCMLKLKETNLIPLFPFLEIIYFGILPIIYFGGDNKRKERWR